MATATELLVEAQTLTKIAEDLEASVNTRVEQFEAEIAADRAKVAEAKREAARKISEAARAIDSTVQPSRATTARRARGNGGAIDDDQIVAFVKNSRTPVGAAEVADHLGTKTSGTLSNHLKALVEAGTLKKTGERRGTKYSA